MALANTTDAIGAVTQLLQDQLFSSSGLDISVGKPEDPTSISGERLNLFLYEAIFDPHLKNTPLLEGQLPPLWLVLKYLLTPFVGDGTESDSVAAHKLLGKGISALQKLSYLPLNTSALPALSDNPEVLKITFEESSVDLLSKLMQGSDEKYRFSLSFQVRPVMIATGELPSHSLLVGVDYTASPPDNLTSDGIRLGVLPAMRPVLSEIDPLKFELNASLMLRGSNLNVENLSVHIGSVSLPVTVQNPSELQCLIDETHMGGAIISAGNHPISVVQTLTSGRKRTSNLLIGSLLPALSTASFAPNTDPAPLDAGKMTLNGFHLGTSDDDVFVSFYQTGKVVHVFDDPKDRVNNPDQTEMVLTIPLDAAVDPGDYRIILHVNGQQARNSPEVTIL